jgi:5-methylcytosine-specific restriction endonuclease McrA
MARPYDSRWQAIRPGILNRDNHTCQIAGPGCTTQATDVDHIIPLNEGGQRLDPTNLRAACTHCNSSRGRTRQAELVRHAINQLDRTTNDTNPSRNW